MRFASKVLFDDVSVTFTAPAATTAPGVTVGTGVGLGVGIYVGTSSVSSKRNFLTESRAKTT